MAGRVKRPRGGPRRLGPPANGEMRQLTVGEATGAGITRGHLVFDGGPRGMHLFEPVKGHERHYRSMDGGSFHEAMEALIVYWRKR